MDFWVGIDDKGREGEYRLLNGTKFNPGDRNQDGLYYWDNTSGHQQPDNAKGRENCVLIQDKYGLVSYNDDDCSDREYKKPFHGLCEFKHYTCF